MKKIFSILAIVAFMVAFASCKNNNEAEVVNEEVAVDSTETVVDSAAVATDSTVVNEIVAE